MIQGESDNMKKPSTALMPDLGSAPLLEMVGNRRVTVEGSTGILLYETSNIKMQRAERALRLRFLCGAERLHHENRVSELRCL